MKLPNKGSIEGERSKFGITIMPLFLYKYECT